MKNKKSMKPILLSALALLLAAGAAFTAAAGPLSAANAPRSGSAGAICCFFCIIVMG